MKYTGIVKFFNANKGYGFISGQDGVNGGKDVFFHIDDQKNRSGLGPNTGDTLTFDIGESKKGPKATNWSIVTQPAQKNTKKAA